MAESAPSVYGLVLAGGSGMRFWPLSREMSPKQLLTIFGSESLIRQAIATAVVLVLLLGGLPRSDTSFLRPGAALRDSQALNAGVTIMGPEDLRSNACDAVVADAESAEEYAGRASKLVAPNVAASRAN